MYPVDKPVQPLTVGKQSTATNRVYVGGQPAAWLQPQAPSAPLASKGPEDPGEESEA